MPTILDEIVEHKKEELAQRKQRVAIADLERLVTPGNASFEKALRGSEIKLVTEIKPASPSGGVLQNGPNIEAILETYDKYASAISVLTDAKYFSGSLDLLQAVTSMSPHPVLCKDFILDRFQLLEARVHGAQAVLLIVKILDDVTLAALHDESLQLGMTPVVEVQNDQELQRALVLNPRTILINNRNLSTFEIEFATTAVLSPLVPQDIIVISASGIEKREHIERLLPFATRFLIGSSLMKSADPDTLLRSLLYG